MRRAAKALLLRNKNTSTKNSPQQSKEIEVKFNFQATGHQVNVIELHHKLCP